MAFLRKNFLIFSLRVSLIFTLGGLFLPHYLKAAPILVRETTVTESSSSVWFEEANTQINNEGFSSNELEQSPNSTGDEAPPAYKAANRTPNKYSTRRMQTRVVEDNDHHGESSLKQLLRSYLNASSAENNQNIKAQNSKPGSATLFIDEATEGSREFLNNAKGTADDLLAKTVSFVLQPSVSDNNLMTFSILGFGEFTLFGGKDGFVLSIGEVSISLFGNNFDNSFENMGGTEPGLTGGSTSGAGSGAASGTNGAAMQAAYLESGEKNDSEGSSEITQNYNKGPSYNRMFAFILDVLTYPATLLILLGVLIFNFIKSKRSIRSKKKYQRSSRSGHRRARSYRKRITEDSISSSPTKQVI